MKRNVRAVLIIGLALSVGACTNAALPESDGPVAQASAGAGENHSDAPSHDAALPIGASYDVPEEPGWLELATGVQYTCGTIDCSRPAGGACSTTAGQHFVEVIGNDELFGVLVRVGGAPEPTGPNECPNDALAFVPQRVLRAFPAKGKLAGEIAEQRKAMARSVSLILADDICVSMTPEEQREREQMPIAAERGEAFMVATQWIAAARPARNRNNTFDVGETCAAKGLPSVVRGTDPKFGVLIEVAYDPNDEAGAYRVMHAAGTQCPPGLLAFVPQEEFETFNSAGFRLPLADDPNLPERARAAHALAGRPLPCDGDERRPMSDEIAAPHVSRAASEASSRPTTSVM